MEIYEALVNRKRCAAVMGLGYVGLPLAVALAKKIRVIAVPTPIKEDHTPDLTFVQQSSRTVGMNLRGGTIVAYESTVYPGVT